MANESQLVIFEMSLNELSTRVSNTTLKVWTSMEVPVDVIK